MILIKWFLAIFEIEIFDVLIPSQLILTIFFVLNQVGTGEILQVSALGHQFAVYRGKSSQAVYVTGERSLTRFVLDTESKIISNSK